jgi:(+)-trans-carveol dehydrogenase
MIDVNLSGVWKTVKAGVPHLIVGGRGGSIVLTGSVGGMKAFAHAGHYIELGFAPFSQMMHTLPVPSVEPVDISNAVLFFASDESRYVTGVQLPVDAGSLLK